MRRIAIAAAILALAALPATADTPTRWINVHVTEASSNANVEVHLPLSLVVSVLHGIDVDEFRGGKIRLDVDDVDVDWSTIMAEIADAPDGKFVTITSDDADVDIRKEAGFMYMHVDEKGGDNAKVDVTVPMSMVRALTIDENNELDVAALLTSLDELPNGELVRVSSDDANVRVWIE